MKQPQMYGLGFKTRNPKQVRLMIEDSLVVHVDANLSNQVTSTNRCQCNVLGNYPNMTVLLVVTSTVLVVVPPIWSADRRYIYMCN